MEKTYFAKVAFSRFVFKDGHDCIFAHGRYVTSNEQEQKELDEILGLNPNIFTQDTIATEVVPKVEQNARSEAEIAATDAALNKLGAVKVSQEVGAVEAGAGLPTDPNASTLDPAIQHEMFKAQDKPQSAAERIAAIKAGVGGK